MRSIVARPAPARLDSIADDVNRLDMAVIAGWAFASLFLLGRLVTGLVALRRMANRWTEAREDGHAVLVSAEIGPAVIGFVQPRIVIPRWMLDDDAQTRAMLLRHELEHLRANDTRVLLAAALLDALIPWNVPMRWMLRRLRLALEIDCDHRTLRSIESVGRYGLALVRVAERHAAPLPAAACLLDSSIALDVRIHAMSNRSRRRPIMGTGVVVATLMIAIVAGACAPWPAAHVTPPVATRDDPRSVDATASLRDLLAVPDAIVRRAASAAYEKADEARRGSGATIWILSESTGAVIGSVVFPPGSGMSDGPYGVEDVNDVFPQAPVMRYGLEFTQIQRRLVVHGDTVTAVWAQMMPTRSADASLPRGVFTDSAMHAALCSPARRDEDWRRVCMPKDQSIRIR